MHWFLFQTGVIFSNLCIPVWRIRFVRFLIFLGFAWGLVVWVPRRSVWNFAYRSLIFLNAELPFQRFRLEFRRLLLSSHLQLPLFVGKYLKWRFRDRFLFLFGCELDGCMIFVVQLRRLCMLALLRVGSSAYREGRYIFYLLRMGVEMLFDFLFSLGLESFPYCMFFKLYIRHIESLPYYLNRYLVISFLDLNPFSFDWLFLMWIILFNNSL